MAKKSSNKQSERLFEEKLVPAKPGSGELFDVSYGEKPKPVECLGMMFPSDDARRAHFTEKLREKLKDPAFRRIEGFPIGDDEDILAMSDPPYYTACPNPFLEDFITHYRSKRSHQQDYVRDPFAFDITQGKSNAVYTAHTYHTKVPHEAIMRFILHYTEPGDIVLDAFCGTGMTGVAAQFCASPPSELKATLAKELPNAKWGARVPILLDLSPFATYIAHNYNSPIDVARFQSEFETQISQAESEIGWAYRFAEGKDTGEQTSLAIWSDVYVCSNCGEDIVYWGNGIRRNKGEIDPMPCPSCGSKCKKNDVTRKMSSYFDPLLGKSVTQPMQIPVLVRGKRTEREATKHDMTISAKCLSKVAEYHPPVVQMMLREEPWGDVYRAGYHSGITHIHHFYNPRQLLALSCLFSHFKASPMGRRLQLVLTSFAVRNGFRGNRFVINTHNPNGRINGPLTNCLYFPSLLAEQNIFDLAKSKSQDIVEAFKAVSQFGGKYCLSTESASGISRVPDESIDYIFLDPPFGANIMYSEMNFIVESWLGCVTNNKPEAIVNSTQKKDENAYRTLMTKCLEQMYRVLKPGRWLTMEFHNSQNAIWNAIQTALGDAGFIIADVRTLDKQKGTVYQETYTSGATKNDLIISAYKPHQEFERSFKLQANSGEGVWEFSKQHLQHLPVFTSKSGRAEVVAERQNFLLYDRMVAFHVQRGFSVPVTAAEFHAGLRQRYPERDGMFFLPEQIAEYDRKRMAVEEVEQLTLFVSDERSAIQWVRQALAGKPMTYQTLQPIYMREAQRVWEKHEQPIELKAILDQNCVEDSTGVWHVPDPKNESHLEQMRSRALLKEFEQYRSGKGKLKIIRTEALRAGFKDCWQRQDYSTIVEMAKRVPDVVIQEDQSLLMYYDNALMRVGE
jgi:16S rRNA G966 N2-methylase RsmD